MKITKQLKKNILKWTEALRSGEYAQSKHQLQSFWGFCCLGVACKVFIPPKKQVLYESGSLTGVVPLDQENAPEWLKGITDDFLRKTGEYLADLNDNQNFTFDEIADVLEAVYVHEVLEGK